MNRLYLRICIWAFTIRAKATREDVKQASATASTLERKSAKLESIRDMLRAQLMAVSK